MISSCIQYKRDTGEIVGVATGQAESVALTAASLAPDEEALTLSGAIQHNIGETEYITDGLLTPRPQMAVTVTVAVTGLLLQGIPAGATLRVDKSMYELGDASEVELELGTGKFDIEVTRWPYIPFKTQVMK